MSTSAFQLRSVVAVLFLILGIALGMGGVSRGAQADHAPPKELVQYVREARRRGLTEAKVKQQAVAVGWSAVVVDEAIAYEKTGKPLPTSVMPPAAVTATPQVLPLASNSLQPADQQQPSTPVPNKAAVADKPGVPAKSVAPTGNPVARGALDDYLIGSGDTLQISVWKEQEASVPSVVVRPDGRITMPLIKEVEVAGLTPRQAEAAITAAIGKFITDPNVTVVVAAINSKKIYLIGAVRKEGTLPYTYGMNIMQALSEAGGLTDYAKRKKIYVLRTENGREYRLDFNYEEVVKGERMDQNVLLLPGDTVVIPQ